MFIGMYIYAAIIFLPYIIGFLVPPLLIAFFIRRIVKKRKQNNKTFLIPSLFTFAILPIVIFWFFYELSRLLDPIYQNFYILFWFLDPGGQFKDFIPALGVLIVATLSVIASNLVIGRFYYDLSKREISKTIGNSLFYWLFIGGVILLILAGMGAFKPITW